MSSVRAEVVAGETPNRTLNDMSMPYQLDLKKITRDKL